MQSATSFGHEALVRLYIATTAFVVATACGSPRRKFPERPSLLEPAGALAGAGDVEWRYHPRRAAHLERSYELAERQRLFVGGSGERWIADAALGRAVPAPMLAPEALIGALRPARTAWTFVGRSGTTYDADSPAGPFVASSAPLVEMAKVDCGKSNIVAVSRDGQLWLSDDAGLGWRQVGPSAARFSDVQLSPPHAVALEVPERLWWSNDEGRSWQAHNAEPFGARDLARDDEAGPVAVSVLGVRSLAFGAGPTLAPLGRSLRPLELELGMPAASGPSARAIARGHAFVSDDGYFEVSLGTKTETLSGPLLGHLERRGMPTLSSCNEARVAGFERWVYVACTRERSGSSRQFEFFRSDDGGDSFEREPYGARGDPDLVRLAVGQGGALLATGFCAPGESVAGCRPQGIARRLEQEGDAGAAVTLGPVAAPALEEHARGLAFSSDGGVAYAVGARTKGDSLFAFVASDLSRGFVARPLATLDGAEWRGPTEVLDLAASNEGQISLVLAQASGVQRLVVLDASGRALSSNAPPVDSAVIGAYGNRALAVSPESVWESLNGGAEWENLGRLPRSICAVASGRCSLSVHCEAGGCVLGDSVTRIGWRGREPPSATLPPPATARHASAPRQALAPAWSCDLSSQEWAELRGVERLPDAAQAALGKAAWYALSRDDSTAAAGLWIAETSRVPLDGKVEVRHSELLGATPRASELAYHATLQVEGAAAVRYRVPAAAGTAGTSISDVEVAWENLFEGQRGRGRIPDAGGVLPGDFVKGDGLARRAQPDLVSIASGGIFVRVHRQPQHEQATYFLDGSSLHSVPALRWPVAPPKDASLEMARLDGESVHLAFVDQGATVVRARRRADAWQFDAMTVGYADPGSFSIDQRRDVAYARGRAGIHLTTRRSDGSALSQLFPLQAEGPVLGPPIAAPTQRDLADPPSACTPQRRADSPRIIAPYQPGRRHPLVVRDSVEPVRVLLTDAAVLHGTPDAPCVDVFDAEQVKTSNASNSRERALLSLDGPSWLFRMTSDNSRRDARVEYRSMTCRPDPGVEVPAEIYDMPGTDRNE
jgi:hypothetical protein